MSEPAPPTAREQSQATVGRLTKLLAAIAVGATALFGVAVASGGKHASGSTTDDSTVVDDSSYDAYDYDGGFDLSPSQGVWPASQAPAATSGGS